LPAPWAWLGGKRLSDILNAEMLATRMSFAQYELPLLYLEIPEPAPYEAGKLIMLLEAATVFAGWILGIDPLDQPAVEEGKVLAKARLGAPGSEAAATRLQDFLSTVARSEQYF
jgi:glucose-6-phosphate isomerase